MKQGFGEKSYNLRSCGGLKKKTSLIYETAAARHKNNKNKKQATEVSPSFLSSSADFSEIPFDLIATILKKLPLKSLCRFKCVSKLWYSLILSNFHQSQRKPIFVSLIEPFIYVTRPQNQTPPPLPLSCDTRHVGLDTLEPIYSIDGNGIPKHICTLSIPRLFGFITRCIDDLFYFLDPTQRNNVYVRNMFTQEQIHLPNHKKSFSHFFEFGFDPLSMKYKMLSLGDYPLGCQIYTLGTKSWRPVTKVPIHGCGRPSTWSFRFNGTMYWYSDTDMVISFNLADESFGVIPGPNRVTNRTRKVMYVFELEGCLCLADSLGSPTAMDLWMLKDYNIKNNNASAWVLMTTLYPPVESISWTIPYSTRTGEILIAEERISVEERISAEERITSHYSGGRSLYLYSFLTQRFDSIKVVGLASDFLVANHIENSISHLV